MVLCHLEKRKVAIEEGQTTFLLRFCVTKSDMPISLNLQFFRAFKVSNRRFTIKQDRINRHP